MTNAIETTAITTTELANILAEKTGSTKKAAKEQIDTVVGLIAAALAAGDGVRLSGFGTFDVVDREARTGRNPQTGEAIEIAASKAVKFKAATALKASVNGQAAE